MQRRTRIAILGAGSILRAHAAGFREAAARCDVVAVAREHPDDRNEIRELFGDIPVEGDWRRVLARDDIDAVDVLLPHDLHLPATVAAAAAGKHVLVEKVMGRNIHECDLMNEACSEAGVTLSVCHDRRYQPDWMALKQVVDSGLLGRTHMWRLEHNQDVDLPPGSWIRGADQLGGGAIMSCLTHQIDALRWYAGEVESVTCMTQVVPARMEGETMGVVVARLRSGALAQLAINWATRMGWGRPNDLWSEVNQVTGDRGEAYYFCGKGTFLGLRENPEAAAHLFDGAPPATGAFGKVKPAGDWTGHEHCIDQWLRMLRGEPVELTTTGLDSRKTVEVAEAAMTAAREHRVVELPIPPRPWGRGATAEDGVSA